VLTGSAFRDSRELIRRLEGLRGRKETRHLEELQIQGMEALRGGQEERALVHFQAILSADAGNVEALIHAGQAQRALRRHREAVELHRKAYRLKKDDLEILHELVRDYEALDQIEKAKVALNRIIQIRPRDSLSAYRKLRTYAMKKEDWERAWQIQSLIESLTEKTPYKQEAERRFNVGIRYQIALARSAAGRDREGANALRKLVRSDPEFVPAHVLLGEVLIGMGQAKAGVEAWARGFDRTGSPVFLSLMEEHFLTNSEPEMAIEALQTAVLRSRKDFLPRLFLARLYLRLEMIDDGFRELSPLMERADDSPAMHALMASIHERRGEFERASREYRTTLKRLAVPTLVYRCGVCATGYAEWEDRCTTCLEWNQISLELDEDRARNDAGTISGPIYSSAS
jgi:lipopolysaccharide biosynthesis regulator YciM